jgi:hypothetical protein
MDEMIRDLSVASRDDPGLVALCFKVPLKFRRWFKMEALKRDVTMTELLVRAIESYAALSEEDE